VNALDEVKAKETRAAELRTMKAIKVHQTNETSKNKGHDQTISGKGTQRRVQMTTPRGMGESKSTNDSPSTIIITTGNAQEPMDTEEMLESYKRGLSNPTGDVLMSMGNERELHIFVDGACILNGKKNAMAAIGVWFGPAHYLNVGKLLPTAHRKTNNSAEILAAAEALHIVKRMTPHHAVCLHTDSRFLMDQWTT
jgi:hypothetical protein